jgi:hypothetical protein
MIESFCDRSMTRDASLASIAGMQRVVSARHAARRRKLCRAFATEPRKRYKRFISFNGRAEMSDKLVRDSFTIPKREYAVLAQLKARAESLAHPAKKSEVLRAGLKLLHGLPDGRLLAALKAVPALKTGRPKGDVAGKAQAKVDQRTKAVKIVKAGKVASASKAAKSAQVSKAAKAAKAARAATAAKSEKAAKAAKVREVAGVAKTGKAD